MAISGICMRCNKPSLALYSCKACGSRCCPTCVDSATGFCKLCRGIRKS